MDGKRRCWFHLWILGLALSPLMMGACTTLKLPAYEPGAAESYETSSTKEGLTLAVEPFADAARNEHYFGVDLVAHRVFPVLLVAKNAAEGSSFVIDPDRIALEARPKGDIGEVQSKQVSDKESGLAVTTVAAVGNIFSPLFAPMMMIGAKLVSDAEVIEHNFETKRFRRVTLSPGKTRHGFLYFGIGEEVDPPNTQWRLIVPAFDLTRETDVEVVISF